MKIGTLLMGAFLLVVLGSHSLSATYEEQSIQMPKGGSINIDGRMADDEWKGALRQEMAGGGEVRLMHDGAHLLIGLRGLKDGYGVSHVCVAHGKDIYVLHASAALGTAIYQRDQPDAWQPVQQFKWGLRDKSQSQEALAARASYLATNGWVATTVQMGNPGEMEFKLSTRFKQEAGVRLAVVSASPPGSPQFWPTTIADDCLKQDLVFGRLPPGLRFKPESWAKVTW